MNNNAYPSHPYILPSRSKNQQQEPKLVKEYGCPTLLKRKHGHTTKCINHWAICS